MWSPDEAERKISLSSIRSLRLADTRIYIGDDAASARVQQEAEELLHKTHPDLKVTTTADGKRQISLQDILLLERKHQQELEACEKSAFERGSEAGYAAGLEKGREEARRVVASLSGALADIRDSRQRLLDEARDKILDMALRISKLDPEITMKIINGAVDQLLDRSKLKVKVHPDHLPELEQHIEQFRGIDSRIKEFILEADPRVRSGGCFIETPAGDVDARLDSMYEVIKQTILEGKDSVQ